ncbi:hypothetical protein [Sinorhizobium meliloti]|uniref:hypothetical protein n=1 Tax=Rhizobium meliloti TaxID=382 RepID=UPI003F15A84A
MATAATVFRDYETDGVPASGSHKVKKSDVRQLLGEYESTINAFLSNGGLIYTSKAAMDADLAHGANSSAWVIGDATVANNGIYRKIGASGVGSWTRVADLPFSFIIASDVGAGTPNAIQATTSLPVSSSALVWMNIFEANTASPVTVSFNGGTALTVKTNSGNDVAVGGLTAGMIVMGIVSGSTFRLVSDQASAAILAQAEAYASAAAAAANAGFVFDTEAAFEGATIPSALQFVETAGYYAPGDGGGHRKVRIATPSPVEPWHKQSADGAWWELAKGQPITVEIFGAKPGLDKTNTTVNDDAFEAADAYVAAAGGGTVYMRGQFYCLTRVRWSPGVYFEGAGFGRWMPSMRTISKTWEGTNLIACGTGVRNYTVQGITSMKYAGGWVAHPDSAGYNMKLNSFMNEDASGTSPATLRQMSVFAANKDINSDDGGIRRCRIVPWIGADGINAYSDDTNEDLGDDWDIGLMLDTAVACRIEDIQVRGYWRMIGFAWVERGYELFGRSEGNVIRNVSAQGLTGLAVRAGDIWRVLATTSNTLTIRWSEESYWPTSGSFEGGSGTDYTYTSLTRSGNNLIFNGVSPAITSESQIRNINRGWGFSTSIMENVDCWGWRHHSGKTPSQLGLDGSTAKGSEFSGFPLRGLHGVNFTSYGPAAAGDGVTYLTPNCMQMHDVDDLVLIGGKLETGFVIGSPSRSASTAIAAEGATLNLRMLETYFTASTDTRLLQFQGGNVTQLQQNPPSIGSANFVLNALSGQDLILRAASGKALRVHNQSNSSIFAIFEGSGNMDVGGIIRPVADATQSNGTQTLRWLHGFFQNVRPGSGAAIWTSGSGSPEGVVSAAVGSMYTRTDGGAATTLYVKESGSGNTGWVAK